MIKRMLCFATLIFLSFSNYAQVRVGKTIMDYKIDRHDVSLVMNGSGTRSSLYAAALYLEEKSTDALSICFEDKPMSFQMKVTSKSLDREDFLEMLDEGFELVTDHNPGPIKDKITYIKKIFNEPINVGDSIEFCYEQGFGVHFFKNDKKLGVIEGQDFKFALYKIWLGEEVDNEKLKENLLGT